MRQEFKRAVSIVVAIKNETDESVFQSRNILERVNKKGRVD